MFNRKYVMVAIFLVGLLALSAVSAEDNATDIIAGDKITENTLNLENDSTVTSEGDVETFQQLNQLIYDAHEGQTLKLEKNYKNSANSLQIEISKPMTIDGQGHTIDANHVSRGFYINASGVTLKNITFLNGYDYEGHGGTIYFGENLTSNIVDCRFINCSSSEYGGAIYFDSGSTSTITDSSFINCSAQFGGAIHCDVGSNIEITGCGFQYNAAEVLGGCIFARSSDVSIRKSSFSKCEAKYESGGAITLLDSRLTADEITISDCVSEFGAAMTLLSSNSTISNSAFIHNNVIYDGGAIFAIYGNLELANSNFTDNNAVRGGGVYVSLLNLSMSNNRFTGNSAEKGAAVYAMATNVLVDENNIGLNPDFYQCVNDNLTIFSDDYYLFEYPENVIPYLPSYYSMIDDDLLTPVKDQGTEGNCWSFAAMATLESCIAKASGLKWDLSEANMKNLMAWYSDYGNKVAVNNGGTDPMIFAYLVSWLGPIFEEEDNYNVNDFLSPLLKSQMHVQNILFLKRSSFTDNDAIKNAILRYGAVASGMHYNASYLNKNQNSYFYNGDGQGNHEVCIVGWDDNYPKSNFLNARPPGDGAWIVRNSWGPSWGHSGYFYVSYYDTVLAEVNKVGSFTFILNDTIKFNRIYQHEIEQSYYRIFYSTDEISYKNIFNVEGDEDLAAVSTYFNNECNYRINIYVNGNQPVATQVGRAALGYYTINLEDSIHLNKGDEVTVEFTCSNFTNRTAVMPVSFKNSTANLFLKEARSYYRTQGKWIDLYAREEVACIKMFTVISGQGKSKPYLNVLSEFDNYDNSCLITVMIQHDATGIVKITNADNEYQINLSETRSIRLFNITDKNNVLFVNYTGDEKYLSRSITYTIDTKVSVGTFEELKNELGPLNDHDVLVLKKDYCFDSGNGNGIDITKSITIDGHGHTISGANISSIFNIWKDNVVLKNIKIMDSFSQFSAIYVNGSNFRIINCSFVNCYSQGSGGAIDWRGADGLANGCSFTDNYAKSSGGAIYWVGNKGTVDGCLFTDNYAVNSAGAIYWSGTGGLVNNCLFTDNYAYLYHGGSIYWNGDLGMVNNCSFIKNSAKGLGGAICWIGFAGLINDSSFFNNSVNNKSAGAIYLEGDSSNITNCRFEGNYAVSENGGAIYLRSENSIIENTSFKNNAAGYGGAITAYSCNSTIKDCNFTENIAFNYGGAVFLWETEIYLINSSFVENYADVNGGAIMWWGERGYLIDSKFEDNFAKKGGSIYLYKGDYNLVNSTFKSLSTYQIHCRESSVTLMGSKFYNLTTGNIWGDCNIIKENIDLKYNNTSFEYANPTILIYSDALRDVPILSQATVKLSRNGATKSFSVNFVDGIAMIQDKLMDLEIGEWNAQITINADDNYYKLEDTFTITVNRASSSITLTAENTTVGHPIEIAASVLDSAKNAVRDGKVTFFDGSAVIGECSVVNGNASITYAPTDGGKHTIKAVFTGDRYVGCEDEATVFVDIASVETVVDNAVVGYQTVLKANVKALYSAITDGSVSFYVGDTFVGKGRVTNGAARFTYVPLNATTTTVKAVYSDSERFADAEDTAEFAINQADSNMTIGDWNGNVSASMTLTAEVTSPNGQIINEGTVTFYDANEEIGKANVTNGAASIIYIPSKAGERMFKAVFKSDNYKSSEGSGTFVIEKSGSEIKISDIGNVYYNTAVTITASVSSNGNPVNDGTVTFYIDGNRFKSNVKNGYAGFSYVFADVGSHNISASFESENHYPSDDIIVFNVDKAQTSIASSNVNMVYNGGKYLALTLKDNNGMPLAGMSVTVNINGAKIVNTDANGQARVALDGLAPKVYSASIVFAGNDNYAGSSANVKVTVSKDASKLTASKKTYKAKVKTKKYTVTLKDSKGRAIKNVRLTLKVKGKTFKATTNSKGKATFKIKKLSKKGKHTATVKFAGNAFYGSTTKKVKITVK